MGDPARLTELQRRKLLFWKRLVLLLGSALAAAAQDGTARAASPKAPSAPRPSRLRTVKFAGEVRGGETFERRVAQGLVFRLRPNPLGWDIELVPAGHPDHDLASVVTPPYHGINALDIEGWHFRMADNSGPNDVGPQNVNAPQEERKFKFVLDEAAHRRASVALDHGLWPHSEKERDEGWAALDSLPRGHGILTIQGMRLDHLRPGERAGFEWMRFAVELVFPRPGERSRP